MADKNVRKEMQTKVMQLKVAEIREQLEARNIPHDDLKNKAELSGKLVDILVAEEKLTENNTEGLCQSEGFDSDSSETTMSSISSKCATGATRRRSEKKNKLVKREEEVFAKEKQLLIKEMELMKKEIELLKLENRGVNRDSAESTCGKRLSVNVGHITDLIPCYNPEADDYGAWELQVQEVRMAYNIDPLTMKTIIVSKLRGRAMMFFHSKPSFINYELEELLRELGKMFRTKLSKLQLKRKFEERVWQQQEIFNAYFHDKVILGNKLEITEEDLLEYIIEGMKDPVLEAQARIAQYTTTQDFLQAFTKLNKVSENVSRPQHKVAAKEFNESIEDFGKNPPIRKVREARCSNCHIRGHSRADCRKPEIQKGACFVCGEIGHFANDCPKAKKNIVMLIQEQAPDIFPKSDATKERAETSQSMLMKTQREKEALQTELEVVKGRWDKAHSLHQKFQMERDDAITEVEILKEKLDKALYASQKLIDEKDTSIKEFEKMLEKHDRAQNEIYRLQSRCDTAEADRTRLEVEAERSAIAAAKSREDLRKLQEESTRLQEACGRAALQLSRSKELEEKAREELELQRDRFDKMQSELRRAQGGKKNLQSEIERLSYELERVHNTHSKANASLNAAQEETARYSLELDKMRERYEKSQSELRRLQESDTIGRETRRVKEENEKLRDRLDKTLMELETIRGKSQYESESYEKYKEKYEQRELEIQNLESKLHETTLQLELSKSEVSKLIVSQDKQRNELERAHIECEKVRDKHEKLLKEVEGLRQNATSLSPGVINPNDKQEIERLRERLDKAIQSRDATELEAGRLAKELEKTQIHLAKQQEANESTRTEFERMSAELSRVHKRLERAEAEKESLRQSARAMGKSTMQSNVLEKNLMNLEADCKQLTVERDQLVLQLEKSQDMLMNFQKGTYCHRLRITKNPRRKPPIAQRTSSATKPNYVKRKRAETKSGKEHKFKNKMK